MTKHKSGAEPSSGLIVSAHGRHYVVEIAGGELLHCYPRGKRGKLACGDLVMIERSGDQQGAIIKVQPRTSLVYRSDQGTLREEEVLQVHERIVAKILGQLSAIRR